MENSALGLTLLEPDHKVVVTGEEHHQPALAGYAPRADGRSRRVAVELGFAPAQSGRVAIEVKLDGRRVGELTPRMSQRYAPVVDDVLRQGLRPGAVALVVAGRRGWVEMELRLPEAPADIPPAGGTPPPRPGRRRPTPGPDGARPPRGRRSRAPYWVGGGVLALLIAVGAAVGDGGDDQVPTIGAAASAPSTVQAAAPTTTPAPTTVSRAPVTTNPTEVAAPAVVPPAAAVTRAPRPRTTAAAEPAPEPRVAAVERVPEPAPRPAPAPAPAPEPVRAPAPEPSDGGCHPSYSPCVPDGPDLDCPDLDGPYTVTGPDEFRLDADDDGVGCE